MNKDKLNSTNAKAAMTTAYVAITGLQNHEPHLQVAAIAILFKEVSENTDLSVSELMRLATSITKDADTYYEATVRGLRDYVTNELN